MFEPFDLLIITISQDLELPPSLFTGAAYVFFGSAPARYPYDWYM